MPDLLKRRWAELPAPAKTATQLSGRGGIACGATHGLMERCNLACTSCYLSDVANKTRPLPYEEVQAQLDHLREVLGYGAKVQITSGEVTLLPLEHLGRIIKYADDIGLDPMVMTNGVRFLREPEYLTALVRDYGLRKVSIHVDTTQRGRRGLTAETTERDLNALRDSYADLIRSVRAETGARLHAAQTMTVTPSNVTAVADVVKWALDNADAFRILSLLPAATVGRTEDDGLDIGLEELWDEICGAVGCPLNRHAMHFGHPECNITVPVLLFTVAGRHVPFELVRTGSASDAHFFETALGTLSTRINLNRSPASNVMRAMPALLSPRLLLRGLGYALRRTWSERKLWKDLAWGLVRRRDLRVRPFLFVVHNFMSAEELQTPLGKERLDACVFKLPVDGELVSMCRMNATSMRREINLELVPEPTARRQSPEMEAAESLSAQS